MANPIQATSALYKNLCTAYQEEDKRVRFESCYKLADEASYEEIHYVISMLKEAGFDEDLPDISIGGLSISNIIKGLKSFIGTEVVMRKAFLLDILEEARERKRTN